VIHPPARACEPSYKTVYSILSGKGVRQQTMAMFRTGLDSLRSWGPQEMSPTLSGAVAIARRFNSTLICP